MPQSALCFMCPSAPADHYLDIRGTRLRYRDTGRGPAVVLVHGWTLDSDMWEPQSEVLSHSFRMIRMDRRGHGLSRGQPSLADDASDIVELLQSLDIRRFALLGMSQGARVALHLASLSPERVTALILDGPPFIEAPAGTVSPEIPYDQYRAIAQTKGLTAFRREWRKHSLTQLRSGNPPMQALLDMLIERYPGYDLTGAIAMTLLSVDLQSIARARVPTLIVSGEYDLKTRQESARWLAAHLEGSIRRQIPNAGHLSGMDNPSAYNQVLSDFLMRHAIG
jgi:pimeloyl-ACP methyl ester carboxylesterase